MYRTSKGINAMNRNTIYLSLSGGQPIERDGRVSEGSDQISSTRRWSLHKSQGFSTIAVHENHPGSFDKIQISSPRSRDSPFSQRRRPGDDENIG